MAETIVYDVEITHTDGEVVTYQLVEGRDTRENAGEWLSLEIYSSATEKLLVLIRQELIKRLHITRRVVKAESQQWVQ